VRLRPALQTENNTCKASPKLPFVSQASRARLLLPNFFNFRLSRLFHQASAHLPRSQIPVADLAFNQAFLAVGSSLRTSRSSLFFSIFKISFYCLLGPKVHQILTPLSPETFAPPLISSFSSAGPSFARASNRRPTGRFGAWVTFIFVSSCGFFPFLTQRSFCSYLSHSPAMLATSFRVSNSLLQPPSSAAPPFLWGHEAFRL